MKWLLTAWVIAVIILHQDNWNWDNSDLILGALPVGLVYHACYAVLASITLALLVKFAWPTHLEEEVEALGDQAHQVGGH